MKIPIVYIAYWLIMTISFFVPHMGFLVYIAILGLALEVIFGPNYQKIRFKILKKKLKRGNKIYIFSDKYPSYKGIILEEINIEFQKKGDVFYVKEDDLKNYFLNHYFIDKNTDKTSELNYFMGISFHLEWFRGNKKYNEIESDYKLKFLNDVKIIDDIKFCFIKRDNNINSLIND